MLKEERQQKILELLNEEKKVIASELSKRLTVSEDTIRRDFRELDEKGLIRRVHSGALRVGPPVTSFTHRQNVATEAKKTLGEQALSFLKEDTVIIIDGGTTNLHLVKLIPIDFKATIITNSPPIATALAHHANIETIMLGGVMYKESMVNLGLDAAESLALMRADLYIMGIYNIDSQAGISVPTLAEAQIKRAMAKISTEVLGLVTADKLETVSKNIVVPADVLTYLIVDEMSEYIQNVYSQKNIIIRGVTLK